MGNEELKTPEGETINSRVLSAGGLTSFTKEPTSNRMTMLKRLSGKSWSDDFHIFEIEWKSGTVVAKVDRVQYGEQIIDESFAKSVLKFYYFSFFVNRDSYHLHSFTKSCNDAKNFISFIAQSYLTLGVAVGGSHEFQDNVISNGYVKPWRNVEAMVYHLRLNFSKLKKCFRALY